ncbi:MAG TPA: histidine kinase [Bacteroidales bacterium]|nr:histidine kinase [Bacteroidales bacterium]HPF01598.1 histidine kinase [Bacteroidales bacterium]HPJ59329.1 histidine kinase [Bacteroidales bacterium]HPR13209.1 histidine kinase [Bacteroidales bacterium]HRW83950.1 histidine kinase [Bacteroidales bacterium]
MKHPILTNRVRLTIWWLVWLFIALGQALSFYYAYGSFINVSIPDILLSMLIYSGLALSLWYPFSYFNREETRIWSRIVNLIITGGVTVTAWVLLTRLILNQVLQGQTNLNDYWDATFPYRVGTGIFIYLITILSYFLFTSLTNLAEKKSREARLESIVRETELKMLRSQINPHFLFNSLNSVSSLTITDPEKAREMVIKLSDFMRYALSRKDEQPVSLKSEFDNLRLYLDIEKVRFGDRLVTIEEINPECLNVHVPVMLLQPLYENAIKHGVYESTGQVRVCTKASIVQGSLKIEICNDFDKEGRKAAGGTGTGLANVKRRLELTYGNNSSMITGIENGIYTVTMYIPAENRKI